MKFEFEEYEAFFYDRSLAAWATKIIHKAFENNIESNFNKVLEVGGGEGHHLKYVNHPYEQYFLTDIDLRPLTDYAELVKASGKLVNEFQDSSKLTYVDNQFDRVIFMCVLHHVNDIEKTLKEARRVAKSGGLISIYLPTDPAILYRLLRKIFTFNQSRKLKTDYEHINALTHRNHFFL